MENGFRIKGGSTPHYVRLHEEQNLLLPKIDQLQRLLASNVVDQMKEHYAKMDGSMNAPMVAQHEIEAQRQQVASTNKASNEMPQNMTQATVSPRMTPKINLKDLQVQLEGMYNETECVNTV